MARRLLRLLLPALLVSFALIAGAPAAASAHAVLVDSSPRDGSRLERAPHQVRLDFDEPVRVVPGTTRVITSEGDRVDTAVARTADQDRSVIIGLRAGLGRTKASYLVSWRVVSADSHLVDGSLRFGVGRDPVGGSGPQPTGDRLAGIAGFGTALTYAGLVAGIGTLAVSLLVWPSALTSRRLRPVVGAGVAGVLVGSGVQLAAAGAELIGSGWSGLLQPAGWRAALATSAGRLLLARMIVALMVLPLGRRIVRPSTRSGDPDTGRVRGGREPGSWNRGSWNRGSWRGGWALAATGLLVLVAAHGHAVTGSLPWLAILATTAHLAGMCCWLGGLLVLIIVVLPRLHAVPEAAGRVVAPWSRFAFGCVAVLIISGELLAWRQIQPIEGLWRTRYGIILLIKLALAAFTLLLGRLTGRLAGRLRSLRRIRVRILAEIVLGAMIITAATVLSATPPAVDTYGPPVTITESYGQGRGLTVTVVPTRRGPQQITVAARTTNGAPARLAGLAGRLSSTDAGVAAIDVHFARADDVWHSTDATAPLPGIWTLQLTAQQTSGPAYVTSADYRVW